MRLRDLFRKRRYRKVNLEEFEKIVSNDLLCVSDEFDGIRSRIENEISAKVVALLEEIRTLERKNVDSEVPASASKRILSARDKFTGGMKNIWSSWKEGEDILRLLDRAFNLRAKHSAYLTAGFPGSYEKINEILQELMRLAGTIEEMGEKKRVDCCSMAMNMISEIRDIRASIDKMSGENEKMENLIGSLEERLNIIRREIEEFTSGKDYTELREELESLDGKLKIIENDISRCIHYLRRPLKKLEHLHGTDFRDFSESIDGLENVARSLKKSIDSGFIDLKDRNRDRVIECLTFILNGKLREIWNKRNEILNIRSDLEKKLQEKEKELHSLRSEMARISREIETLKDRIERNNRKMDTMAHEIDGLISDLREIAENEFGVELLIDSDIHVEKEG